MSSQSVTIVERVKQNSRPSGLAAYAKAVRKFNLDTPLLVAYEGKVYKRKTTVHAVSLRKHNGHHHHHHHPGGDDIDEVSAKDVQHDIEYVVPVTIGTPGVTLNLDFDTGSSDLWVWATGLPGSKAAAHHIYDPKKSSTAKPVEGAKWNIGYGDGSSASGIVYTDVIRIGDLEIREQGVEAATKMSKSFEDSTGSDGLLGLAWPTLNTVRPNPVKTPVENIIQQGTKGVFSVILNKNANGYYTFGGIDPAKAGVEESQILYTPIDSSEGFWQFKSEATVINGKVVEQPGNTAILDTGTTLCVIADEIVQDIYRQIPGAILDEEQGGYVYPIGSRVPEVDISIGGHKYRINPSDFEFGLASKEYAFGGIQSRGNNPFDILGDVFLKSIYAVFDQEHARVGVAQRPAN